MNPPPGRFETSRLRLRRPTLDDAEAIFDYASDPKVTRFLVFITHREVETVRTFLRELLEAMAKGNRYAWAITLPKDDRPIGMFEFRIHGTHAEFGYVLSRRHWGNGYMSEAIQPILDWALQQDEIYRVWALCDVENQQSARVLEKLGLTLEGVLRKRIVHPNISSVPRDSRCYSRVKE